MSRAHRHVSGNAPAGTPRLRGAPAAGHGAGYGAGFRVSEMLLMQYRWSVGVP